ncbi:DNA topoisomerase IB [Paludisphaera soli]|uniref:DNA topoisomerase IB n=1 Tax=Paludisphaera soli TaxID=2712865 RepID=UPI0013EDFB3E|nr:DNA topoisomerase IB [Paludisphaera soli]
MSTKSLDPEAKASLDDAAMAAKAAGLRYVSDARPGLGRRRSGKNFRYVDAAGKPVRDEQTLARIKALAIPPAWTDVWICPSAQGHLQATGRDEKGRKQYRYHARWRTVRDDAKYGRMAAFGQALPRIREATDADLKLDGMPRRKVLAAVVQLLELSLIRVGNEEYARTNKSFGLTTMRNKHVAVEGPTIQFQFKGKSGVKHRISIKDRRLARVVARCQDLPGQELFTYLDDESGVQRIDSADVNEYLREASGQDFTAKDFRTWAGTVLASMALQEFEAFDSDAQAKKNIVQAVERVAERLGNTPSVCRKCYVHPAVLDAYLEGSMLDALRTRTDREIRDSLGHLKPEEAAVLALLQNRLAREDSSKKRKAGA